MNWFLRLSTTDKIAFIGVLVAIITLLVTIYPINNKADNLSSETTKPKEDVSQMEMADVLKIFSTEEDNQGNIAALDWSTGSTKESQIKWLHSGLKFIDSDLSAQEKKTIPKTFGSMIRQGIVEITNDGKPSHTILEETVKPVGWNINLFGVHGGADIVTLSNNVIVPAYEELDGSLKIPEKYIKNTTEIIKNEEMATDTYYVSLKEIKIPKKRKFWILSKNSCGGVKSYCNYSYAIFLQTPRQDQIEEFSNPLIL